MVGTPASNDFTVHQGDDEILSITYQDPAGDAIDLSGYSAQMQVRETVKSTSTVLDLSTSGGEISITGGTGLIEVTIDKTTSTALTPGTYKYDLQIASGAGIRSTILKGDFTVNAEVTR